AATPVQRFVRRCSAESHKALCLFWRKLWDSNPRDEPAGKGRPVYRGENPAHSTSLPSFRYFPSPRVTSNGESILLVTPFVRMTGRMRRSVFCNLFGVVRVGGDCPIRTDETM